MKQRVFTLIDGNCVDIQTTELHFIQYSAAASKCIFYFHPPFMLLEMDFLLGSLLIKSIFSSSGKDMLS